jgi:uncharacterized protein (DUF952 family)
MSDFIYHVCRRTDWEVAKEAGAYEGSADDQRDGFIHFSTADQVAESVARHRAGQTGLVLLTVSADKLGHDLRWEESRGGQLFPHLYGSLSVDAVVKEQDLALGPDGAHHFPELG